MMKNMALSIVAAKSESIKTAIASARYDRSTRTGICVGMDTSVASSTRKRLQFKSLPSGVGALSGPPQTPLRSCLLFVCPDAHLAGLRHEEQAQDQAHRRDGDRVDQRIGKTTGRLIGRRGDEW